MSAELNLAFGCSAAAGPAVIDHQLGRHQPELVRAHPLRPFLGQHSLAFTAGPDKVLAHAAVLD